MCERLNDLGMMPNKSLKVDFPELEDKLYSHFIRGYFDGNGSLCVRHTKDGKFRCLTTITSTENFCKGAQRVIKRLVNIPGGGIYDASCKNGITRVFSLSGRTQNQSFYEWLYQDAELYLYRKRDKVKNLYEP